jgi:hypothetical protein
MSEFMQQTDPIEDNFATIVARPKSQLPRRKKKDKKDSVSPKPKVHETEKSLSRTSQNSFIKAAPERSGPKTPTSKSKR